MKLPTVNVTFFSSGQSELLAFQSGQIDQLDVVPSIASTLGTSYRQVKSGYVKFDGLTFNVTKAPFNNAALRQAVAWALDRQAIVKTAYAGQATVGTPSPWLIPRSRYDARRTGGSPGADRAAFLDQPAVLQQQLLDHADRARGGILHAGPRAGHRRPGVLTRDEPFDFDGEFYRVRGAYSGVKPVQVSRPVISLPAESADAVELAARFGDMLAFHGVSLAGAAEKIAQTKAAATAHGQSPGF